MKGKEMKRIIRLTVCALLIVAMMLCSVGCQGEDYNGSATLSDDATHVVTFEIENYGKVEIELYGELAPITVDNFVKLVKDGHYNNSCFHRIIDGFVAQGGDVDGSVDGMSTGNFEEIFGEFESNGFENPVKHERGTISMARSGNPNSASTQFFIVLETSYNNSYSLDGNYAAFGKVVSGMGIIDLMSSGWNSNMLPASQRPVISKAIVQTVKK